MAVSLLFTQQKRAEDFSADNAGPKFRFAVILAGRVPLVSLDPQLVMSSVAANAAQSTLGSTSFPDNDHPEKQEHVLRLLTVHVHGKKDQGLHLHKRLLEQYCEKGITRLIEWDGSYRVPLKTKVVAVMVEGRARSGVVNCDRLTTEKLMTTKR